MDNRLPGRRGMRRGSARPATDRRRPGSAAFRSRRMATGGASADSRPSCPGRHRVWLPFPVCSWGCSTVWVSLLVPARRTRTARQQSPMPPRSADDVACSPSHASRTRHLQEAVLSEGAPAAALRSASGPARWCLSLREVCWALELAPDVWALVRRRSARRRQPTVCPTSQTWVECLAFCGFRPGPWAWPEVTPQPLREAAGAGPVWLCGRRIAGGGWCL